MLFPESIAGRGWRSAVATVCLAVMVACGGGGAAADVAGSTAAPPGEPAPGTPTAQPSSNVVTTSGTSFTPAAIVIAPGASVTWQIAGATHNVTFGGGKPAGGDIPDTQSGGSATRVFANTGTFAYQCTRHSGMTGQVVVSSEGAPPPSTPPANPGSVVQVTSSGFSPERVEIARGGVVTWEFAARADGVVFDNDAPPGGNIPESAQGSRVSRTFPAAGDHDYHSLKNPGSKGRVRVR